MKEHSLKCTRHQERQIYMTSGRCDKGTTIGTRGENASKLPDIKPRTAIETVRKEDYEIVDREFPIQAVSVAVGMAPSFIRRVIGKKNILGVQDVLVLIDQDAYKETLVPRSQVVNYLVKDSEHKVERDQVLPSSGYGLVQGHAVDLLKCQGRRQNIPVGRSKSVPPERSLASVNVRASCSGEVSQRQAGNRLGG